ncbi:hypothetical protein K438DRAFT_1760519 [Mycena galopus ATCC 62051]|nr:hypothetical protein K438DRAFT_1760519 [Mycena galopus ATCC 62051]
MIADLRCDERCVGSAEDTDGTEEIIAVGLEAAVKTCIAGENAGLALKGGVVDSCTCSRVSITMEDVRGRKASILRGFDVRDETLGQRKGTKERTKRNSSRDHTTGQSRAGDSCAQPQRWSSSSSTGFHTQGAVSRTCNCNEACRSVKNFFSRGPFTATLSADGHIGMKGIGLVALAQLVKKLERSLKTSAPYMGGVHPVNADDLVIYYEIESSAVLDGIIPVYPIKNQPEWERHRRKG